MRLDQKLMEKALANLAISFSSKSRNLLFLFLYWKKMILLFVLERLNKKPLANIYLQVFGVRLNYCLEKANQQNEETSQEEELHEGRAWLRRGSKRTNQKPKRELNPR